MNQHMCTFIPLKTLVIKNNLLDLFQNRAYTMKKVILICMAAFLSHTSFSQSWTVMADMPHQEKFCGAAVIDDVIYVVGGYDNAGNISANTYAYHPATNTWETKAPMNHPRGEFVLVAIKGQLYAMGGYNYSGVINSVEQYNPFTDTWTDKAPMITARSQFSGAYVQGSGSPKIYTTCGFPSSFTNLEVYDITTDSWSTNTPMPYGVIQNNGATTMNGKLYVIGGKNYSSSTTYANTYVYTPSTDSWAAAPDMPVTRFGGPAVALNHKIYYLGGSTSVLTPTFNTNYCFDSATQTWSASLPLISQRSSAAAVAYGGSIYLFGGTDYTSSVIPWTHKFTPATPSTASVSNVASSKNSLNIYPNPSLNKNVSVLVNAANDEVVTLYVYNSVGQLVKTQLINSNEQGELSFNVSGVYYITAKSASIDLSSNIIVQ